MSAVQLKLLERIRSGETLARHFDVWGGYWWELAPSGDQPHDRTVRALIDAQAIEPGETLRPYSGRQVTPYRLCPSAAPAIREEGKDG